MSAVGEVRARLIAFVPVDAKLEITLCQGDIRLLNAYKEDTIYRLELLYPP